MEMVSTEISAAIHQIIVNGAALLVCTQQRPPPLQTAPIPRSATADLKFAGNFGNYDEKTSMDVMNSMSMKVEDEEMMEELLSEDLEIIELDEVELLAEHIHFCDICGKGFKRDANLRMHMRAHGDQYKSAEALAKPEKCSPGTSWRWKMRFSCPFVGCKNKSHKKFRPLKSAICVKNHFKSSHCPKMCSCNCCNKKSFTVVADLKSHLKHCGGESKWKCSCGTCFSRKYKLFGHMALFEGHMLEVVAVAVDEEVQDRMVEAAAETGANFADSEFFDGLLEGFQSMEGCWLQDVLESPNGLGTTNTMNQFYNF